MFELWYNWVYGLCGVVFVKILNEIKVILGDQEILLKDVTPLKDRDYWVRARLSGDIENKEYRDLWDTHRRSVDDVCLPEIDRIENFMDVLGFKISISGNEFPATEARLNIYGDRVAFRMPQPPELEITGDV